MANSDQVTADLQRQREAADLAAQYPPSGRPGGDLLRPAADAVATTPPVPIDDVIGPVAGRPSTSSSVSPPAPEASGSPVAPTGPSEDVIAIITRIAKELGVDPKLALAIAQQESGLDPNAIGDGGHSVGLFQLNDAGEGSGMSVSQRQDAETNARIALTQVAAVAKEHPDWTPGQIAAAAQRPADQAGYAQKVNALYQGGTFSGGGVTGGSAGAGSSGPGAELTPQQIQTEMRAKYGYLGSLLDRPDIAKVITDGITQDQTGDEILANLYGTDTWRSTQASMRQWLGLQAQDPASAEDKIRQQQADIGVQAAKMGIDINAQRQRQIAIDSIQFGWDSTQLNQALAAEFHYQPGKQTGVLGTAEGQIRTMAHDYMVPLDDATLAGYDMQVAQGVATPDAFRQLFVQHAQSLFPGIANQITTSTSTNAALSPWRTVAAQELGIAPDTIDFSQPKWNRFVNQVDPKTGVATPMSLYDTQRTIRGDDTYGWQYTKNGQDAAYQFQHAFLNAVDKAPA